ncbi:type IV pili methyl-accepting chemotaxis transducer N-terminal domain-containing protein [Helicobacter burdigaliensis]|uniref:type IV pili methyl-accepting chemotaxis transducer N-terminal domain-containing protein n=1 Tax=Helicobacter burdigaliensis TaxID=2315334 RepID=UPI000EF7507F|nr:type IV pili methyl-accepting chemotaxis transducer N-terminal domain-containing protein [Helicobacter burdigaliensis]
MKKIITRLVVVGILIAFCVGVMMASILLINQRSIQDGIVINIVGKQRMLSQMIAKEVFMNYFQDNENYKTLKGAIEEFEANLVFLESNDYKNAIKTSSREEINKKLAKIRKIWSDYKQQVEDFMRLNKQVYESKEFVDQNKIAILQKIKIETLRMMIENMCSALAHYMVKWDERYYEAFKRDYKAMEDFMQDLQKRSKTEKFEKDFEESKKAWEILALHLNNVAKVQKELSIVLKDITKTNMELLAKIDETTNYYSKISVLKRAYLEKFQFVAFLIMLILASYALKIILDIRAHLKQFVDKTQLLAKGNITQDLAQKIRLEGESELSIASLNLSTFINRLSLTKETSDYARELSVRLSDEIFRLSEEIKERLKVANLSKEKQKSIEEAINLSEDIAIQSSEQLIVTAKLLEKLQKILREIEEDCN